MNVPLVQIDVTTAADFKGLFQTIVVRRFKNTVGIRYEMVQSEDSLLFNSYAALYNIADNQEYFRFASTGTVSKTGEKFRAKRASQQAAAEIGIQSINQALSDYPYRIPHDQGESMDSYPPHMGYLSQGSFFNQPGYGRGQMGGRGLYELVSKRDWKGQLQTSLLRKYRGAVDIKYTFSQSVRTDEFESIVILSHADPSVGSCIITGDLESTKKASEKSAAEKACNMLDADTLKFIPYSAESMGKNRCGIDEYPLDEPAQELGTALKGLFGNNYTSSSAVAPCPPTPPPVVSYYIEKSGSRAREESSDFSDVFKSSKAAESQRTNTQSSSRSQDAPQVFRMYSLRVEKIDPSSDTVTEEGTIDKKREKEREGGRDMNTDSTGDRNTSKNFWPPTSINDFDKTQNLSILKQKSSSVADPFHDSLSSPNKVAAASLQPTSLGEQRGVLPACSTTWDKDTSESPWLASHPPSSSAAAATASALVNTSADSSGVQKPVNSMRPSPLYRDDHGADTGIEGSGSHAEAGAHQQQQQSRGVQQSDSRAGRGTTGLQKQTGMSYYANGQYDFNTTRTALSPTETRPAPPYHSLPLPERVSGTTYDSVHNDKDMNLSMSLDSGIDRREQGRGVSASAALNDDVMKMLNNARTENILLRPSPNKITDSFQDVFSYDQSTTRLGAEESALCPSILSSPASILASPPFLDNNSDSKYRIHSFADEMSALQSEKKATDWKGELQTFLARNCKDYPFKIEYNSEDRVAGGKFVARVTITFDNKEEEMRVVHGIPAINKKTTERTAAGIALEMFHNRQLSIPRIEDDFKIGTGVGTGIGAGAGQSLNPSGAMDESDYNSDIPRNSLFGETQRERDFVVKDWKGRLQTLLARRYRGVFFKICYDAPKSSSGIFKAFLMIIPTNVDDLVLKVCEGKSSRVKKISEQSVAEVAVKMLENETLEVRSASTEKYKRAALDCAAAEDAAFSLSEDDPRQDNIRKCLEQRRPKRSTHYKRERVDSAAYYMQNSSFLYVKYSTMQSIIKMVPDNDTEIAFQHRHRYDRTSPVLCNAEVNWKSDFISRLLLKFHSQLDLVRDTGDNDPFSITIDFGHTFFINAEAFFDTSSPCVTVLEMENALHVSKRNRASAERPAFTLQPPVRDRDREREGDGEKDRERESETSSIHLDLFSPSPTPSTTSIATPAPNPTHTLASLSGAQSIQVSELRRLSFERAGFNDEDFDFQGEATGTHNTSGTGVEGSQSSSLAMKRSEEEPVDHFSFLAVGDAHPQSTSMSMNMGMGKGMRDALGMSKDNDKERNTAKKVKGVLHGFRSSVFCHKIQSARKTALPPSSSSSRPIPSHTSHPQSGDMVSNDIDYHYKVAEACLSPLLVKAGFEEIDGIIECGPQAGLRYNPLGTDCEWQVRVVASSTFHVDVRLTAALQVVAVMERSLCWVNAILLSGAPLPSPPLSYSPPHSSSSSPSTRLSDYRTHPSLTHSRYRENVRPHDMEGDFTSPLQALEDRYIPYRGCDPLCHNINAMNSVGHSHFHRSTYTGHTVAGASAVDSSIPIKKDDDILHGRRNVPYSSSNSVSSSTSSPSSTFSPSPSPSSSSFSSRASEKIIPSSYGPHGREPHWSNGSTVGFIPPQSNNAAIEYAPGRPDAGRRGDIAGLATRQEHPPTPSPSAVRASVLRSHDVKIKLSSTKCLQPEDALYDVACPLGGSPIDLSTTDPHPHPIPSSRLKPGHKVVSVKQLMEYKLFRKKIEVKMPSTSSDLYSAFSDTNMDTVSTASSREGEDREKVISLQYSASSGNSNSNDSSVRTDANNNNDNSNNSSNSSSNSSSKRSRSKSLQIIDIEAVAVLSKCHRYEGEGLEDSGPVVTLSLEIACEPLTQYLRTRHIQQQAQVTRENIDIWFKHLFDHIATLSDNLNTCVMKSNNCNTLI